MTESEIKRYQLVDTQLEDLAKQIPYLVNPINVVAEYKKFFSMPDYNPQFKYKKPVALNQVKKGLMELQTDDSPLGQIFSQKRDILLQKIEMTNNMGEKDFTKNSVKIFGKPDRNLLKQARKILKAQVTSSHEYISVDEAMRTVRNILRRRKLNWPVKKKDMLARAAVRTKHKALFLKEDAKFSPTVINRLIIHEIGTHIFRAQNGLMQPYKIFSRGFPNYLMTEEGLAVVNEEVLGVLNQRILKIYAARTIAANMALRKSFNEVYHYLIKFLAPIQAWRITTRVKRGVSDTALPGAYTKDHLYLKGYNIVKRYLQRNGDIIKLYYGKIGIEHIDMLKDIPGLVPPKFLPIFSKKELQT